MSRRIPSARYPTGYRHRPHKLVADPATIDDYLLLQSDLESRLAATSLTAEQMMLIGAMRHCRLCVSGLLEETQSIIGEPRP